MRDAKVMGWFGWWSVLWVLSGMAGWFLQPAFADQDDDKTVQLYRKLAPGTVFLSSAYVAGHMHPAAPPSGGIGAGFVIDETGTVLTNAHVVDGASVITATLYSGQRVKAELLGIDPMLDVAVLRLAGVEGKLEPVPLGDSDKLQVGQKTLVIGSPFGLGFTLSTGIVSGLGPTHGGKVEPQIVQTTAPINPGNSGGPLVDAEGRVVGITTSLLEGAQNIGFAIPINQVKAVVPELKAKGRVVRPWIGIGGKFITDEIRLLFALPLATGLLIENVEEGSPAAEAGLRTGTLDVIVEGIPWLLGGDILTSVQGQALSSPVAFIQATKALKVGQAVQLDVMRDGERRRLSVTVRERPGRMNKPPADGTNGRPIGAKPSSGPVAVSGDRLSF